MHIRKRVLPSGKERWQVRISNTIDGRRVERARDFSTAHEARSWSRQEGAAIEDRSVRGSEGTFANYSRRWLDHLAAMGQHQPKSLLEYRQCLGRVLPFIGGKRLDRLSPADLEQAYAQLLQRGGRWGGPLSARTVVCTHRVVFMALKRARRWKLIGDNPAAEIDLPARGRSPARAPTSEELERYLAVMRPTPYWPLVLAGLCLGLRRGEILGLRWSDVDLTTGVLRVTQVIRQADRRYWLEEKPKTPAGLREISIPAILAEELARLRLRQKEERLAYGRAYRADLDLVFTMPGGEPWAPDRLTRLISYIARRNGLPPACAPLHSLRHAHASALLGTVPLKVVSARLGHASTRITADTYTHVAPAFDRAAADAIEVIVRPLVTKREP
jgi:integrase